MNLIKNESSKIKTKKYLIFSLSGERFAVPLSQVKEVIGQTTITPVPDVPSYYKGLINLRGRIITTIDLRDRLSIASSGPAPKRPCIVISDVAGAHFGSVVDDVVEVLNIDESEIDTHFENTNINKHYFVGVAKLKESPLALVLNLENIVTNESQKEAS